jgi:hypothetical protein
MNSRKRILLVALALVFASAATVVMIKRQAASEAAKAATKAEMPSPRVESLPAPFPAVASPRVAAAAPETASPAPETVAPSEPVQTNGKPQTAASSGKQGGRPAKEPLKDPAAREALAFVGADPEAEAYWYAAINNPALPARERQDLIEDLNEDGLSDPKHPGLDDLPLIVNRILLIEELGPSAMDQVNADAFAEAYKDLVNLANLAMGDGTPVR